jgi:hypothetical protein
MILWRFVTALDSLYHIKTKILEKILSKTTTTNQLKKELNLTIEIKYEGVSKSFRIDFITK